MNNLSFSRPSVRSNSDGYYSVFDAIQFIAQKTNQHLVWKRLVKQYPDIVTSVSLLKFAGLKQTPKSPESPGFLVSVVELSKILPVPP